MLLIGSINKYGRDRAWRRLAFVRRCFIFLIKSPYHVRVARYNMLGNLRDFNFRLRDFDTLSTSIFSELFERGKKKNLFTHLHLFDTFLMVFRLFFIDYYFTFFKSSIINPNFFLFLF